MDEQHTSGTSGGESATPESRQSNAKMPGIASESVSTTAGASSSSAPVASQNAGSALDSTPLNRMATERVLARAAELHNAEGLGDPTDVVSETQLLEIAREVGLSSTSVRQAIAEERTRLAVDTTNDTGWLTRVAGPGIVSATRVVRGKSADVMTALDTWMQQEECLQVQRRFSDRVLWEARMDWFNTIRRGLKIGGRSYQLCRAESVAATVIQIDDERVLVRLDADVIPKRVNQARIGGVAAVSGVAFAGSLITVGMVAHASVTALALTSILPIGLGGFGGYVALRQHRRLVARMQLSLELALDRLEFADARKPTSLLDVVAAMRPLVR